VSFRLPQVHWQADRCHTCCKLRDRWRWHRRISYQFFLGFAPWPSFSSFSQARMLGSNVIR
jgi:hypothetical protein